MEQLLRDKPAPFLKYNKLPDKCVVDFMREHNIKNACEFGCGEGRNAIYLAKNDVDTEAYDLSEIAIENAKGVRLVSGATRSDAHEFYRHCGYGGDKRQINFKKMF